MNSLSWLICLRKRYLEPIPESESLLLGTNFLTFGIIWKEFGSPGGAAEVGWGGSLKKMAVGRILRFYEECFSGS